MDIKTIERDFIQEQILAITSTVKGVNSILNKRITEFSDEEKTTMINASSYLVESLEQLSTNIYKCD